MAEAKVVKWGQIPEEAMDSTGGAVLRRFLSGEKLTVAQVAFEAGAAIAEHSHENEQIAVLLSGKMEFVIAGESNLVLPGQMVYLPPNVPHSARALEASIVLDTFSPPRTDWEKE